MTHTALAVELGFDPAADAAVRDLWEDLAAAGISSSMVRFQPGERLAVEWMWGVGLGASDNPAA